MCVSTATRLLKRPSHYVVVLQIPSSPSGLALGSLLWLLLLHSPSQLWRVWRGWMPRQLSLSLREFSIPWTKFWSILDCVFLPGKVSLPIILRKFSFSIPKNITQQAANYASTTSCTYTHIWGIFFQVGKKNMQIYQVSWIRENSNIFQQYLIQLQPPLGKLKKLELLLQASSVITQACNICYPVLAGSNVCQWCILLLNKKKKACKAERCTSSKLSPTYRGIGLSFWQFIEYQTKSIPKHLNLKSYPTMQCFFQQLQQQPQWQLQWSLQHQQLDKNESMI